MRPFYSVKFNARMCNMKISVNGVPLFVMEVEGQCSTSYPFNHLLLDSGPTTIRYEARPLKGAVQLHEDAYLRCEVVLFDMDSHKAISKMASYETPPQNETVLPFLVHEEVFHVEVPYSLTGWKRSVKLDRLSDHLRTMVFEKYNSIMAIMQSRSFLQYEQAFREREDIFGVCYFLSEKEKQDRMKDIENDIMNSTRIVPLSHLDVLEFAADDRLVRLLKEDGESALRLFNEAGDEIYIELWLHMKPGNSDLTII